MAHAFKSHGTMSSDPTDQTEHAPVLAATRNWLERAVIGLNLCPFARSPHAAGRIRYRISVARSPEALAVDLQDELRQLAAADPAEIETTLLIHPHVLGDFLDYNDFLDKADRIVARLKLQGVLQVASFHPRYQFAGTAPDDIENNTNRSPYPMLHLLRECSIDRAVAAMPDTERIYLRNIDTLRRLGHEGWRRLMAQHGACAPNENTRSADECPARADPL